MPKEIAKLAQKLRIKKLRKGVAGEDKEKHLVTDICQTTDVKNETPPATSHNPEKTTHSPQKTPSPRRFYSGTLLRSSSSGSSSPNGSTHSLVATGPTSSNASLYEQINHPRQKHEDDEQSQKQVSPSVSFNIKEKPISRQIKDGKPIPEHSDDEESLADMLHAHAQSEGVKIRPISIIYQDTLGHNAFEESAKPLRSEGFERGTYSLSEILKLSPHEAKLAEEDDQINLLEMLRTSPEVVRTEQEQINAEKSPSVKRRRNSILGLQSLRREKETDNSHSTKTITLTLGSSKAQHTKEVSKQPDLWRLDTQLQALLALDNTRIMADGKTALEIKIANTPNLIEKIREEINLAKDKQLPTSPHEKLSPKIKDQTSKGWPHQSEITIEKPQSDLSLLLLRALKINVEIFTQLINLIHRIEINHKGVEHLDPLSSVYGQTLMTLEHDIKEANRIIMAYEEIDWELSKIIDDKSFKNENDLIVQLKVIAKKLSYEQVDVYCKHKTDLYFANLKSKLTVQEQQLNSLRAEFADKIKAYDKRLQEKRHIPKPIKASSLNITHSRTQRQQIKPFTYHWEGAAATRIAALRKRSRAQLIVLDVDDTLLILDTLSRLKNGHLLIPVLQFATALGIPIGIATSRYFALDYGTHQGLGTINEMLELLTMYQIGFCIENPDLIIDKEVEIEHLQVPETLGKRDYAYHTQFYYKNFHLQLIRQRYQAATQAPTKIEKIRTVLVDDNRQNIAAAHEAGYRTITVPLDDNIDYIRELASEIGLDKYLATVEFCSKLSNNPHQADPPVLAEIAKQYESALANHSYLNSVPIYVNQDIPQLFNLIRVDQATAIHIIKSNSENRFNFANTLNKFKNENGQTLLGYALERNAVDVITALLNADANTLAEFSFKQKETLPIIAAIQLHSNLDILVLLLKHGAMDLIPKSFAILNAALEETSHPHYANMIKKILKQIVKKDGTNALINLLNKTFESGPYAGHSLFSKAITTQNEIFLNMVFNMLSETAKNKLIITPAIETLLKTRACNPFDYFIYAQLVNQLRDVASIKLKPFVSKVKHCEENAKALPELRNVLSKLSHFAIVSSISLANNPDANKFIIYFAYAKERLLETIEHAEFVDIMQRLLTLLQALEAQHQDVTTVAPCLQSFLTFVGSVTPVASGVMSSKAPLAFFQPAESTPETVAHAKSNVTATLAHTNAKG